MSHPRSANAGFVENAGPELYGRPQTHSMNGPRNWTSADLDNPSEARMACHIYADTQLPWYKICEDLPKFAEKDADAMLEFIRQD